MNGAEQQPPAGDEEPAVIAVPGFLEGGRVNRTGIALVHEGEYILPAPGSEASVVPDAGAGGQVIHYHFPVEVVVVGRLDEHQVRHVARHVYRGMKDELDSRR